MEQPLTASAITSFKNKQKITMLTAYDYTSACILDRSGIDVVLVGDSLGMAMLGREDTLSVTMDEMVMHTSSVSRGTRHALVVADMPFMTYEMSTEQALSNAGRLLAEGGARAVKLEGAYVEQIEAMTKAGIPVMGHLGLTPQRVAELGGFKVQGKTCSDAQDILDDSFKLQNAGCFALVLECIPAPIAKIITNKLNIPTIGIGAGPHCDGQVLVMHDLLGLFDRFIPRFVKRYAELGKEFQKAVEEYCTEVRSGVFPGPGHCFNIAEEELKKLEK